MATTDAVAPVSTEVDCRDCHAMGEVGADSTARLAGPTFVAAATGDRVEVEAAAKHNTLALHDFNHGTTFVATNLPVLCASCHRSNALAEVGGPGGVAGISNMSNVMHGYHGRLQANEQGGLIRDGAGDPLLIDPPHMDGELPLIATGEGIPMEQNCFNCHPGKITQCFRGAMYTAGQKCDDCHGADHRGTRLARVPVARVLRDAEGNVRATLAAGEIVSCDLCHSLDKSFED